MQGRGTNRMLVSGTSPSTSVITFIHASVRPKSDWSGGTVATLFSLLQATSQAPQPVQRSRSITMPQRVMASSRRFEPHERGEPATEAGQWIGVAGEQPQRIGGFPTG